jgi:hypothetical protein
MEAEPRDKAEKYSPLFHFQMTIAKHLCMQKRSVRKATLRLRRVQHSHGAFSVRSP